MTSSLITPTVAPAAPTKPPTKASVGQPSPKTPAQDRASQAFEAALKLYKSGQYRAAIDRLIEARKLDPNAKDLPYNLGLLHEKLGEIDDAIRNFQVYLALEPDEAERERVAATVRRLEGARAEMAKAKPAIGPPASASAQPSAAPAPTAPPAPVSSADRSPDGASSESKPMRGRLDGWVFATAGVALAGAAAGAYFGASALSQRPVDATTGAGKSIEDLEASAARAHRSAVIADVGFGVAIAVGGASVLLYLLRDRPASKPAASTLSLSPRGVAWVGAF